MGNFLLVCDCGHRNNVSLEAASAPITCAKCNSGLKLPAKPRIGDLLLREKLISHDQLTEALRLQENEGGKIVENLISLGYLDQHDFISFLAKQPGVASIDLQNYSFNQDVLKLIPAEFALKHEILPIDKLGRFLTVSMVCPLDSLTIKELEESTGLKIQPMLGSKEDIRAALKQYYKPADTEMATFEGFDTPAAKASPVVETMSPQNTQALAMADTTLTFEGVVNMIRKISVLPALPQTVTEVRDMMEDPNTSTENLVKTIEKDPSLTAKLLSLANSAAFGFKHNVDNLPLALSLLGLGEIYNVVLSSAVIDYFDGAEHFDYEKFWKRSMVAGTAAKLLGKACGQSNTRNLFTAGLLHDLGRIIFVEIARDRYLKIDQRSPHSILIAQEFESFGISHPEVGYLLAENWALPDEIKIPMRFHHDFSLSDQMQDLVAIVNLASMMADSYEELAEDGVNAFIEQCKEILVVLELDVETFVSILSEIEASMREESD
jgi:HD-like signal output (HDOD) protein